MPKTNRRMIVSQSLLAALATGLAAMTWGCNDAGPAAPPVRYDAESREAARSTPPADPSPPAARQDDAQDDAEMASFLGIRAPRPATWIEEPPQSMMHHTTFRVPGSAEGGTGGGAQIVVFFFGPGQGGPIDANIGRWEDQFRSPTGTDVQADVRTLEADGMPVTMVELEGEYRGMGAVYAPNQRFITAIIDAPGDQRIFIRFVGDHATVTANRDAFMTMIEEMEWAGQ